MSINLSLNVKLGQNLTLTPQLQQAIFLLQLSNLELQTTIQEYLETNPFLEQLNQQEQENTATDDRKPETATTETNETASSNTTTTAPRSLADTFDLIDQQSQHETLHDHLTWQVNCSHLDEKQTAIATAIIDTINDKGYLTQTIEDLQKQLNDPNTTSFDVLEVLNLIQNFEPAGVAARNMQECLLIQLQQLEPKPVLLHEAITIISSYLDLLAKHDYQTIQQRCKINETQLSKIIDLIHSLNPEPGREYLATESDYVIPDVIVKKIEDRWVAHLNDDALPHLRINEQYTSLVNKAADQQQADYLKRNLQEARWLLRSLSKRNDTLIKVANYIVDKQQEFLEHGTQAMRPMVIREVAEAIEMHDSTVSRISNSKYIATPQGVFSLKHFFSSQVSTQAGEGRSSTAIKELIKQIINDEDPSKPLSDSKITELLKAKDIDISRRTVAKYREALLIPPSSQRKRVIA